LRVNVTSTGRSLEAGSVSPASRTGRRCFQAVQSGGAAAAVDARKRERLRRAAHALLAEAGGPVRVDVVAMELTADGLSLRHVRNAVTGRD